MIFLLSLLCLLAVAALVVFLWNQCQQWQKLYTEVVKTSHDREEHFLNTYLVKNGMRPTTIGYEPKPPTEKQIGPVLESRGDDDERLIFEDRIRERMEAGIFKEEVGQQMITQIRAGNMSSTELDLAIWKAQRDAATGSVLDF